MPALAEATDGMALSPLVTVGGTDLPAKALQRLIELSVLRAVRTIGRCVIRFEDPGYGLAEDATLSIGARLAVRARGRTPREGTKPIFSGTITSISIERTARATPQLRVVAEDAAYALARTARTATYQQMRGADVVGRLSAGAQLRTSVKGLDTVHEYLLQTGTDLAFVEGLARRYGCDWIVDDATLHVWPTDGKAPFDDVTLDVNTNLIEFGVRVHDEPVREVKVRGWDPKKQSTLAGEATAATTGAVPSRLANAVKLKAKGDGNARAASARPVDASDADRLASAELRRPGWVEARGLAPITPGLVPGGTVTAKGVGPAGGTYPVLEVEHLYRGEVFRTRFVAGDRRPDGVAALAMGLTDADPDGACAPGLLVGTVSDLRDPEGLGRVRVLLPTLGDEVSSAWARVATVGGGKDRGIAFLPEIDDEVLVGFEGGDERRPVVLGGMFGSKATLPKDLTAADGKGVASRRIRSRLGHVVELRDGEGQDQHVLLSLAGEKVRLRLGKDKVDLEAPNGVPVKVTAGSSTVTLDGQGAVKVEATTVSIKGTQSVSIEGGAVTIKATHKLDASGAIVAVKGQASTTVEASGQTAIKGGMVMIN